MISILIFVFGLIVGSFLNVVIFRLHEGKNVFGRSVCLGCQNKLRWYDNIPILSFIVLRGQCRRCKTSISWQYPIVELVTGLLFVVSYLAVIGGDVPPSIIEHQQQSQFPTLSTGSALSIFQFSIFLEFLRNIIFTSFLIVIFVYDLRWYQILDRVTIPAAVVALVLNLLLGVDWKSLIIGAIIGGGFFLVQYVVSSGRWVGGGDIRLGAVMGLMLGWNVVAGLMASYFIGAVVGVLLIITKRKKLSSQVPFGTFLSVGTIMTLFYGEQLIRWYLELVRF